MAMRLSGLMSGMDTQSIIQDLVAVRQTKVDKQVKAQKKLEWKQEKWKDLNTKLKGLQSKMSNLRFEGSYMKKTTKVSNSDAASILTGDNAVNGVQDLKINHLAKTAYLTGAEISKKDGTKVTALTKVSELGNVAENANITLNGKKIFEDGEFTSDTTISDVLSKLKNAGLNASFDEKNQRIFVSAKESGAANDFNLNGSGGALTALGLYDGASGSKKATKIDGQDAEISLNGAIFTGKNNVFEINGLTITALQETKDEVISVTTQNDTDGIYDMIKGFLKEYNTLINEIDKLYNAKDGDDYDPLTDEEKDAMSENEVEEWEKKIKDTMLGGDSNLSAIRSSLINAMASGIEVGGETLYLSSFGIGTLGYFNAADNEKNMYHIDGDADDKDSSGNADKLKKLIASDPDKVIDFFTGLSKKLYTEMDNQSKSVAGYRSYGSFYDDKKMKDDYAGYTSKIADLEEKLNDYEDSWYKKFAAMEKAMASMQSNMNAVSSLFGGF